MYKIYSVYATGRARLQLEAEEDNTIHRNRQRMLNVYATRYVNLL